MERQSGTSDGPAKSDRSARAGRRGGHGDGGNELSGALAGIGDRQNLAGEGRAAEAAVDRPLDRLPVDAELAKAAAGREAQVDWRLQRRETLPHRPFSKRGFVCSGATTWAGSLPPIWGGGLAVRSGHTLKIPRRASFRGADSNNAGRSPDQSKRAEPLISEDPGILHGVAVRRAHGLNQCHLTCVSLCLDFLAPR